MPRTLLAAAVASVSCLIAITGHAQPAPATAPVFDPIYGSGMVLPHGIALTLTGVAAPAARLTLEVDGRFLDVVSDDAGRWQAEVAPLAAGGPYQLAIRTIDGSGQALADVLAGELWLCSGQSNMAYSVAASSDVPDQYVLASPAIRLLTIPQRAELEAMDVFADAPVWQHATDETVPGFSAVCYFAARRMLENNGIPLGLINASWGGSAIEAWISEAGLATVPGFDRKVAQLQQFRSERRAAELAFADDWVRWWSANADQGAVWEQGVLDTEADWRAAPLVNWKTYPDERLANHHGIVWFSTSFELPERLAGQRATFVLGRIDEVDTTWINGRFVQNTFGYGTKREYPLEPGVLQAGVNQITVNVLNTWDVGGMLGPAEEVGIRFADGSFVALGEAWQYRYIPRSVGEPPRSPWESVAGVAGMFNGMIAPLEALQPDGVIWYQGESNAASSASYRGLLSALIADWRWYFNDDELPFIIVQLPNYGSINTVPGPSGWATIRQAQQQIALADDRVGLVATHDVGNDADIHPRQKFIVGERVAAVASALAGDGGVEDGVVPSIALADAESLIMLEFSPPLVLAAVPELVEGFTLCDRSGTRCEATVASHTGSRIAIETGAMPDAALLRFCWSDGGACGLRALNGLPVSSFEIAR
jgi:sialate O-acetylesterase